MDSRSFTLPKGEYFFGDLGYLFPHPNYPTVLNTEWIEIFCANEEGACEDWKKAAGLGDEDAAKLVEENCE